ncbi:hypothetical protein ACMA5I_04395 [Paracoccaceae bacterium GXU_MW_L88]
MDYRGGDAPSVLAIEDLDIPEEIISFPAVENFLKRLRRFGIPKFEERDDIGDARLSSRESDVTTFWFDDPERDGVSEDAVEAFVETWGFTTFGLPAALQNLYKHQNGGRVRYRFAAPFEVKASGHPLPHLSAPEWIDVFPSGLLPLEEWRNFEEWRSEQDLATDQSLYDFTGRVEAPILDNDEGDVQVALFVIGDHDAEGERVITLLDMSSDFFNRNEDILTLRYDEESDRFEIMFGPVRCASLYQGPGRQVVKALKSEIEG